MSQIAPDAKQAALIQEFAAELTMTPEEEAATGKAKPGPGTAKPSDAAGNMDLIMRIPVQVRIVLGSATMPVSNLAKLGRGAVIPLDRKVGEPVDVVVNGRIIARGEVVVMDEGTSRFGIKLTELIGPAGSDRAA
jgi:flagellar motor switch protein FliN/FliY